MNRKTRCSRLAAALACVLFAGMLYLPLTVAAAEPETNTLTLSCVYGGEIPLSNVNFRLYRVAEVDQEALTIRPLEQYDGYHVLDGVGDWFSKASTLADYIARDRLPPTAAKATDAHGNVTFDGLEDGMYLIVSGKHSQGSYTYTSTPYFLLLPYTTDGHSWTRTVSSAVKVGRSSSSGGSTTVQCRVLKVWDDDGFESDRPESVTVDLLADGEVYDTVTLSAENNWRHHWSELSSGIEWRVVEEETPGYTVRTEKNGITFTLTNTWQEDVDIQDPDTPLNPYPPDIPLDPDIPGAPNNSSGEGEMVDIPDEEVPLSDLPQTGQLWWPVPILALAGIVLLIFGAARRREDTWDEE